jgi:precorrin-6x reductase
VFDSRFERIQQLAALSEDGDVEIVVIVGHQNFSGFVDANADRIVGQAFAADLSQKVSFVRKHFDAMSAIVGNENLLTIVDDHSVRKLEMFGAAELLQYVAHLIENQNTHDFAFDHNDTTFDACEEKQIAISDFRPP